MIEDTEILVERGIPIPPPNPGRKSLYPWQRMLVGDSFLLTLGPGQHLRTRMGSLRTAASKAAKLYGHKYTARVLEGETPSIRVWRTA